MSNPATIQEKTIHDEVSKHYAGRINSGSCCSPAAGSQANATAIDLYADVELIAVPLEAAQNSFGCGNPTAIASLRAGETVLDLGSGGGLDAFLAARQVGETGFVYGVDMTDEMLALARRNAEQGGFANVEFRKGQIERLPVDDQSVDVIISNCVINLSPDKEQTLREAYRALRPGGRLAVSDIVIDGTLDDLPVSEEQVRAALSWAGCIAGALTIDDFRRTLETAGFVDVEIDAKHRYKLAELDQDMESVAATLTPEVAEKLVRRFVSANIQARRAA